AIGSIGRTPWIDDERNTIDDELEAEKIVVAVAAAPRKPHLSHIEPEIVISAPDHDDASVRKMTDLRQRLGGELHPIADREATKQPGRGRRKTRRGTFEGSVLEQESSKADERSMVP